MWQLYQFPLCPFTRKVRTLLNEKDVGYQLMRENPWERRDAFIDMNPAGQTPVMTDNDRGVVLLDSMAICEYFEETVERVAMINGTAANRAEIRRLVTWFDTQFYRDVTQPLLARLFGFSSLKIESAGGAGSGGAGSGGAGTTGAGPADVIAADAGSTNTPTWDDSTRWACRISSSVTASIRPPDRSRAASACVHDAGLPIRMAVAMVSGSVIG